MGRLEDIVDRNKHPGKHGKRRNPAGILVSAFVLVVLVLMIVTNFGGATAPPPPPPVDRTIEKRVDGVRLYRPRAPADGGATTDAR